MFSISKETDYALNAIFYISDKNNYSSVAEISEKLKISKSYLGRIFTKLASVKILRSKEGKDGGYVLNKKLNEIYLYDFLTLFEEDLGVVKCDKNGKKCSCIKFCKHKKFFQKYIFQILENELKRQTLLDVYRYK